MPLGRGGGVDSVAMPSTTCTHGHFVLSPVSLTLRDPHLHLRSHRKIGDCEQSMVEGAVATSLLCYAKLSCLDLSPGWGHCVVFLGKTLYSQSASLHPGV